MKATLEFNLDEPFEHNAHMRCVTATDAYLNLYDLSEYLRSDEVKDTVPEHIRDKLYSTITERGVSLDYID